MNAVPTDEFVDFILRNQIISPNLIEALSRELPDLPSSQAIADELVKRGSMTDYQRTQIFAGEGEKLIFGSYRLVEPLGEGGMGMVFKAWHSRVDRIVALKFVRPQTLASVPQVIRRFHREAQAIGQLNHPNVVMLYDADEIDGVPYIAMEFVNGRNLGEIVKSGGPLDIRRACEYMRQAALGLQHAHECDLVHRDIKPSNILVAQKKPAPGKRSSPKLKRGVLVTIRDRDRAREKAERERADHNSDVVKIMDMGLVRLKQSLEDKDDPADLQCTLLTEAGAVLGTPDFISPEQACNPRNVDIRSDLYSLGCTFYCILSGQFPFPGGTAIEKLIRHQADEPKPLRDLRAEVPSAVDAIVQRLMAKRPEARFRTPQELVDVLAAWLNGANEQSAVAAGELPTRVESSEQSSLPDTCAPSQGGSSSLLFWNTCISLDNLDFAGQNQATGIHQATVRDPIPSGLSIQPYARLQVHGAVVSALGLSADARYAASGDVGGEIRIWDLERNTPVEIAVLRRPAEMHALEFTPNDPETLIFGEACQSKAFLRRWDWGGSQLADFGDVGSLNQPGIGCIAFGAEGNRLAAGVGAFAVTWKVHGREVSSRSVFKGMGSQIRAVALSPIEPLLATVGHSGAMKFWELKKRSWSGNHGIDVRAHVPDITSVAFSPDGHRLAMVGLDSRVVLWDIVGAGQSITIDLNTSINLQHVQFTPDGKGLLAVGISGEVFCCDVKSARVVQDVKLNLKMAYRFAVSRDARRFLAGYSDGSVAFFNLPTLP